MSTRHTPDINTKVTVMEVLHDESLICCNCCGFCVDGMFGLTVGTLGCNDTVWVGVRRHAVQHLLEQGLGQ